MSSSSPPMYLYCPNCGARLPDVVSREAQFCPYCGNSIVADLVRRESYTIPGSTKVVSPTQASMRVIEQEDQISFGRTILTGFVWLLLLGWLPVAGPLVAGYKTGSMAGRPTRGLLAGFVVGILSTLIIDSLVATLGGVLGGLLFGIRGAGVGALLSGTIVGIILLIYGAGDILACTLGGLIGGTIKEGGFDKQVASAPLQYLFSSNATATSGNYLGASANSNSLHRNDFQGVALSCARAPECWFCKH